MVIHIPDTRQPRSAPGMCREFPAERSSDERLVGEPRGIVRQEGSPAAKSGIQIGRCYPCEFLDWVLVIKDRLQILDRNAGLAKAGVQCVGGKRGVLLYAAEPLLL